MKKQVNTRKANYKLKVKVFLLAFSILTIFACVAKAQTSWPKIVYSSDSTAISYEVHGLGEQTLVFVHGWSCDSRYWKNQIATFSKSYKVVLLDLAGHGHSGMTRELYTIDAFAEDVKAVIEDLNCKSCILIGHSLGGEVIAATANIVPDKVSGLIGADTFHDLTYTLSQEEYNMMLNPFKEDFIIGTQLFVQSMLRPDNDKQLDEWIKNDMSAAPPAIAISTMEAYLTLNVQGKSSHYFNGINIPIVAVNSDMWPVNIEGNKKHIENFKLITIEETDHFLMMNRPQKFNKALKQAIDSILAKE